ncbi:hypothetical protein GU254_14755 [Vibrio cholerae]|uniref:hypothetical protein n=2 Tax=Gammaproteobacteria TaxID=1236 RepID=UPI000B5949C3|nr:MULTISPECIES: hypothetical protein [Gammaproteobacteria]EGR4229481.1 hypothetical protein [Vibrio cholerae]MBN7279994.1 hypothetical protein [Vibrio paracholerae]ASI25716.1 hypothetical protein CE463_00865 [Aeromonas salmonicida]EJK2193471.1 hypothetical protein [Vibrio cholerae]EKF9463245.1 hypothetical protein [Vibrio cholerae]
MKFNMSSDDNFASFFDEENENHIFVDSFDNENFDVRIGSVSDSEFVGSILAKNDSELNSKLEELYESFMEKRS